MRRPTVSVLLAGAALGLMTSAANAVTCYMLFDRYDNVVYRDTVTPVDLSDQGAAARAALRQRGEYLMVTETDRCPPVTFVFGSAGSSALSIEEFLGGIGPAVGTPGSRRSTVSSTPAPAPASTPRGTSQSGGYK